MSRSDEAPGPLIQGTRLYSFSSTPAGDWTACRNRDNVDGNRDSERSAV